METSQGSQAATSINTVCQNISFVSLPLNHGTLQHSRRFSHRIISCGTESFVQSFRMQEQLACRNWAKNNTCRMLIQTPMPLMHQSYGMVVTIYSRSDGRLTSWQIITRGQLINTSWTTALSWSFGRFSRYFLICFHSLTSKSHWSQPVPNSRPFRPSPCRPEGPPPLNLQQ